ncbi:MAG: trypsin-like serine protease [Oscillospiraceae bacterium]
MFKKVLSMVLSAVMVLGMGTTAFATENSILENGATDYLIYDIETGQTTSHSFDDLPDSASQSSPGYFPVPSERALIGGEGSLNKITNTAQGPYCNTVYIEIVYQNGTNSTFTGFMIGPSAVATAGHCVINAYNNGFQSINVIPAKNGTTEPYGRTTAKKIIIPDYVASGPAADDWAILELNSPIGNQTGWLGLKWTSSSYNGTNVISTGYADYGTISSQLPTDSYMYKGTGTVKSTTTNILKGDWSAVSGFSGGPVFAYYSDTGYTAIGILTGGGANGPNYSSSVYTTATRITKRIYDLFLTYR